MCKYIQFKPAGMPAEAVQRDARQAYLYPLSSIPVFRARDTIAYIWTREEYLAEMHQAERLAA